VIVAADQVVSAKSKNAVVPEVVGLVEITSVLPPAVYPVPVTSFVVLYAVVAAPSVAELVNSAILNVCDVSELKSISPSRRAFLKDVHIACVIAIGVSLAYWVAYLTRAVRIFAELTVSKVFE
jgi:diacylglycerol kinase